MSTGKDCLPNDDDCPFERAGFARNGKALLVADPFMVFLDTADGQRDRGMVRLQTCALDNLGDLGFIAAIALAPDGRRLALGLHTGDVWLCDVQSGGEATRCTAMAIETGRTL